MSAKDESAVFDTKQYEHSASVQRFPFLYKTPGHVIRKSVAICIIEHAHAS